MADHDSLCGRQLGEFILRARIDEGGFGAVYRCDQPMLNRQAVVKVLHMRRQSHGAALQRFSREARLASMLDHPYAAHIYGAGVEGDGLVWIAMEMVQGITLRDWLRKRGTLSLEEFVPLFTCIAEVVEIAHQRGIVHRDLKPSNIMVVEHAGQRWPKLLDFGIAKMLGEAEELDALDDAVSEQSGGPDPETTRAMRKGARPAQPGPRRLTGKRVIGTPQYMAPEQWTEPAAVGPAADLYALGIIAYEVLTGRPPFDVASTSTDRTEELAEMHCSAPVPPIGVGSTPGLEHFFQRALAKRPEDRFATARELAAALEAEKDSRMLARVRSAATHWHDKGRMTGLLWRNEALAELKKWREHGSRIRALTVIEDEFIDASCELENLEEEQLETRARRMRWIRRGAAAIAAVMVAIVFAVFQWRAAYETQLAQQKAETAQQVAQARAIESEVEQGRAALLHDDLVEAQQHLAEAVRRGDHSPATAFMLARASQPLRAEQARFAARGGRMWSAAWSPDGTRIVTADDSAAQIWDVDAHRLVATLLHNDTVHDVVFTLDGRGVVTAGRDGTVRIWRASDGSAIRALRPRAGAPRYFRIGLSPDGRVVAAIDALGSVVHVWDATTGEQLAELPGNAHEWPTVAFSSDGRWLAAGSGDGVDVYETRRWTRATTIPGSIRSIAWDPAGPRLLTGATSGDASIWFMPAGARVAHLHEVGEPVDKVAWSPDGRAIATATQDGAVQVWAPDGRLVSHGNQVHDKIFAIEFDRASRLVGVGGANGAVAISDAATGMPISMLQGPTKVMRTVRFDPSSHRVLGASWDGTARIWDASSPYRRWSAPSEAEDCGIVGGVESDRRVIAIPCRDRPTRIWDTAAGKLLAELPSSSVPPVVSTTGDHAAIARDQVVELYELPGGRLVQSIRHRAAVTALAFGRDLITGDAAGSVLLIPDSGEPLALPPAPSVQIDAVAALAGGRVLAADARGRVRVIAGTAVVAELEAPARIALLRPSPDGDRLVGVAPASAGAVQPVLWDLTSYRTIRQLEGNLGAVIAARWVADGRVLTAGLDGYARMWDGTGVMLVWYRGARALDDAALSPDGELVVAGGADGRLRFWEAATGRPLWTTPAHTGAVVGVRFDSEDLVTCGLGGDLALWRVTAK